MQIVSVWRVVKSAIRSVLRYENIRRSRKALESSREGFFCSHRYRLCEVSAIVFNTVHGTGVRVCTYVNNSIARKI